MSKNTKARITCTTCTTKPNSKPTIEPTTKLEDKIEDLIKSVSFMSQKFDTFETKLENIFKEIKSIKNDNEQIKIENARLTKDMNELKHKIEQIEQHILHLNIRSIAHHLPELECLNNALDNNNHVIITSESWLGHNINIVNYLPFKGYQTINTDNNVRKSDGILVFIKNNIDQILNKYRI